MYNYMDIINESFTAVISFHMFLYTYWVEDKNFKFTIGWSMIVFVSTMLAVNLGLILFYMVKQIKLIAVKYFRIFSRWILKTFFADSS